jgi:dolichol-phosphate mannosyltransferase
MIEGNAVSSESSRSLSVVVPTYKEVENIPLLVQRVKDLKAAAGLDVELLFMDDDSRDGSKELVEGLGLPWVTLHTRTSDRGLSPAVLDGLRRSRGDVFVVMDADLSHPPEVLPGMLAELDAGADFVLGSRFVNGGTTDDNWGIFRWLNSKFATLLALPLAPVKDPMSGFFMIRRATFERGRDYNPIGYKIGLELLVKCNCRRPVEVPIHFQDRQFGKSKLSLKEQLRYLQHIRRLYIFRFAFFSQLFQFLVVGGLGLAVNLILLTLGLQLGLGMNLSVVVAIAVSMVSNFFLNRRFSFSYARTQSALQQFLGFVSACSAGAVVNYIATMGVAPFVSVPQIAATLGVIAGTGFNFLASRYWVFRIRHVADKPPPSTRPPASHS